MEVATRRALVARLRPLDPVVEVAVGQRPAVAAALAATNDVTATDLHERVVPDGVRFVRDDLAEPDLDVYRDAEGIYGLNLPEELQRPALEVARAVDAAFAFTTLGAEAPAVAVVRQEALPAETLFWARE